jgi:hypothetical protein
LIIFADAAGDGVEADGDFTFEVAADCVGGQTQPLAGSLVLGLTVVVMTVTFRVGSVGLEGLGTPVGEEVEVIRHDAGGRFGTKPLHLLLLEVRYTAPLLHLGGEMMRVFCHMDWLGRGHELNGY